MFIYELFEKYLVEQHLSYAKAFVNVITEKMPTNYSEEITVVKMIDNGYTLFCKTHKEFNPMAFRNFVELRSLTMFHFLGWDKK